jgi:peptide/nickel transport system permease protein
MLSRVGQYALVLWAAATLNFALPHLAPGDPVTYLYAGPLQGLSETQIDGIRAGYGLDRSILEQYGAFWAGLLRGDLGISVEYNRPVLEVVLERVPWTLALVGISTLLAAVVGVLLATWATWRRGSDRRMVVGVLVLDAMPSFWIGMTLIALFAVQLGWFPSYGASPITGSGLEWFGAVLSRLVLPVATLALATLGEFFLLARGSMVAVLDEPFVRLARAKGIGERRVALHHALRTALLPVYTNLTLTLGVMLSGSVVVESVFAYPGLGQLIFSAVTVRDYPVLQGALLLVTIGVITANLLADLTYPRLDPRVRRPAAATESVAP